MSSGSEALRAPSAGAYLSSRLRSMGARMREVASSLLSNTPDPEAVHDLRVALRRTRTLLGVGRAVLGRFYTDEVARALGALQRATGAVRDGEVLIELIESLHAAHPDVARWLETRVASQRRMRASLLRLLRAGELERGDKLLDALLTFRVKPSRDRRIAKLAAAALEKARRAVERRRTAALDDPNALHRLRIAHKRLRYTVEAFAEALPPEGQALAHASSRFQKQLGAIHDVDVALGFVRRARILSSPAKEELLAALASERDRWETAYKNELETKAVPRLAHAVGADSLRKTSTR